MAQTIFSHSVGKNLLKSIIYQSLPLQKSASPIPRPRAKIFSLRNFAAMESAPIKNEEVAHAFDPFFRVYKDGRIERLSETPFTPPSDDSKTGVVSKDVVISTDPKISARLYLPKSATDRRRSKLPLLIYIHGGAFVIESAFSALYHPYLNSLVAASDVVAVSVEYRLAPEHPIPACYDDVWEALNWVRSGSPDPWIESHADLNRIFLAGDSAGANIAHNAAIRASVEGGSGLKISGVAMIHPFFGNDKPDRLWNYVCPEPTGCDDPRLNPGADPVLLSKLECKRVLICTAGKDFLRKRGWNYYEALKKSGWDGVVDIVESEGEEHVFHLFKPDCENAGKLRETVAGFLNRANLSSSLL